MATRQGSEREPGGKERLWPGDLNGQRGPPDAQSPWVLFRIITLCPGLPMTPQSQAGSQIGERGESFG